MAAYTEREADRYVDPHETRSEKIRRLWDYYRLPVIIFCLLAAVIGYLFFTLFTREKNDMLVLYVTEKPVNYKLVTDEYGQAVSVEGDKTAVSKWEALLAGYSADVNRNGKTVVEVENLYVGPDGDKSDAARDNKEKIITLVRTAETMLFLCDERGLEYLISIDALEDLSGIADSAVFDGKAVLVGEPIKKELALDNAPLYLALRSFTGTVAEQSDEKKAAFANAKTVLFELCE